MTINKSEKAILILSDIHKNSVTFAKRYQNSNVFDDVIILNELSVLSYQRILERKKVPTSTILSKCCKKVDKILSSMSISLKGQQLYLCPDHFPFGWYVISKRLFYSCFEEGCGVLSNPDFAISNMKRNLTQYKLFFTLGCFGENQYAKEIFADKQLQKEGYENPKMKDFSVENTLKKLNDEQIKTVLDFFGCEGIVKLSENSSLLLTQHMANLGLMTLDEQHLFYKYFADYFLPSNSQLIIKPHPDDIAGMYEYIFVKLQQLIQLQYYQ
jgi:hypothetical protein